MAVNAGAWENRCPWNPCEGVDREAMLILLIARGAGLQRDDDYMRDLLRGMESSDDWLHDCHIDDSATDQDLLKYYHLRLMADAGLLEETGKYGGVFRIRSQGHDFLAITRDEGAWRHVKAAVGPLKGATIKMLISIAEGYAKAKLSAMGMPLG